MSAFFGLGLSGVGRSTFRITLAFVAVTCPLSAFVFSAANVAMLTPTAQGILAVIARLMQDRGIVKPDSIPCRSASAPP